MYNVYNEIMNNTKKQSYMSYGCAQTFCAKGYCYNMYVIEKKVGDLDYLVATPHRR